VGCQRVGCQRVGCQRVGCQRVGCQRVGTGDHERSLGFLQRGEQIEEPRPDCVHCHPNANRALPPMTKYWLLPSDRVGTMACARSSSESRILRRTPLSHPCLANLKFLYLEVAFPP
jgi:hypothetical protein